MIPSQSSASYGVLSGFSLLKQRDFAQLYAARVVSTLGNGFGPIAVSFGILGMEGGSPSKLSIVLACQTLSMLAFSIFGGVIADRVPRARVMTIAQITQGSSSGMIALLIYVGDAPLWAYAACSGLAGLCTALFAPAYVGIVKEVVKERELQTANALVRMGANVARVLGLAMGGGAVALLGAPVSLAMNSLCFVIGGLLITRTRLQPIKRLGRASLVQDLKEGASGFFSRTWLWVLSLQYAIAFACLSATVGVLGPMLVKSELGGPMSWSAITAAQAVGAFAGAFIVLRRRITRPILVAACITSMMAAVPLTMGAGAKLPVIILAALLAGVSATIFEVLFFASLQQTVPSDLISRVGSWDMLWSLSLAPIGVVIAGPAATTFGIHRTMIAFSVIVLIVTACVLLVPSVRSRGALSPVVG